MYMDSRNYKKKMITLCVTFILSLFSFSIAHMKVFSICQCRQLLKHAACHVCNYL